MHARMLSPAREVQMQSQCDVTTDRLYYFN